MSSPFYLIRMIPYSIYERFASKEETMLIESQDINKLSSMTGSFPPNLEAQFNYKALTEYVSRDQIMLEIGTMRSLFQAGFILGLVVRLKPDVDLSFFLGRGHLLEVYGFLAKPGPWINSRWFRNGIESALSFTVKDEKLDDFEIVIPSYKKLRLLR